MALAGALLTSCSNGSASERDAPSPSRSSAAAATDPEAGATITEAEQTTDQPRVLARLPGQARTELDGIWSRGDAYVAFRYTPDFHQDAWVIRETAGTVTTVDSSLGARWVVPCENLLIAQTESELVLLEETQLRATPSRSVPFQRTAADARYGTFWATDDCSRLVVEYESTSSEREGVEFYAAEDLELVATLDELAERSLAQRWPGAEWLLLTEPQTSARETYRSVDPLTGEASALDVGPAYEFLGSAGDERTVFFAAYYQGQLVLRAIDAQTLTPGARAVLGRTETPPIVRIAGSEGGERLSVMVASEEVCFVAVLEADSLAKQAEAPCAHVGGVQARNTSWSPSGNRAAFLSASPVSAVVVVLDIDVGSAWSFLVAGVDASASELSWIGEDRLVFRVLRQESSSSYGQDFLQLELPRASRGQPGPSDASAQVLRSVDAAGHDDEGGFSLALVDGALFVLEGRGTTSVVVPGLKRITYVMPWANDDDELIVAGPALNDLVIMAVPRALATPASPPWESLDVAVVSTTRRELWSELPFFLPYHP